MMNYNMKKIMSAICALGAAGVCVVMIFFEIVNQDIPALLWLAFSMLMFGNAAMIHLNQKKPF